jgi:hypothetical protein
MQRRQEVSREAELQARRLQDDYNDLRQTFESLRVEHASLEARLQIGVRHACHVCVLGGGSATLCVSGVTSLHFTVQNQSS